MKSPTDSNDVRNTSKRVSQFGIGEEAQMPALAFGVLTLLYNAYAITSNLFFAVGDSDMWVNTGFSAFIILATSFLCEDVIKSRWPDASNAMIFGGLGFACLCACIITYFTGNHTGKEVSQYFNSFFIRTYNERVELHNSLLAEINKKDTQGLAQFLKTKAKPRLQDLVKESGKVKVPRVLKATHEAYVKHLNTFSSITDSFIKSIETLDMNSLKTIIDDLSKNQDEFETILSQVVEIAKKHDLKLEK